jgi:hypothetical protein
MDFTEPLPNQPVRPTVESDPAYDFAEDSPVEEDWDVEDDAIDEEERVVPLDADEFRDPEDEER